MECHVRTNNRKKRDIRGDEENKKISPRKRWSKINYAYEEEKKLSTEW